MNAFQWKEWGKGFVIGSNHSRFSVMVCRTYLFHGDSPDDSHGAVFFDNRTHIARPLNLTGPNPEDVQRQVLVWLEQGGFKSTDFFDPDVEDFDPGVEGWKGWIRTEDGRWELRDGGEVIADVENGEHNGSETTTINVTRPVSNQNIAMIYWAARLPHRMVAQILEANGKVTIDEETEVEA